MKKNLQSNILVIGDIMLDQYWFGEVKRISPEAPVPILRVLNDDLRPGGAANVAYNISNFHKNVSLIGLVGKDKNGRSIQKILNKNKVKCHLIKDEKFKTITKLRILSNNNNQQLLRIDEEDLSVSLDKDIFLNHCFKYIREADLVVLSDYGKGCLDFTKEIISYSKKLQKKVLVDPKGGDFSKYKGATLMTPNLSEFEEIVGYCKSDFELNSKGKALLKDLNLEHLLVTLGEKGMKLISRDEIFDLDSLAQEVYDVSGAGDTVISVLAWSIVNGINLKESAKYANAAAGVVVGKVGTAYTNKQEIDAYLKSSSRQDKIINKRNLKKLINDRKQHKQKIVMTNGCFDLLHPGHVSYLSQAKKLGDILIVAVNSDSSVKKLKGKERPINNLKSRMEVLAGLEVVDFVISFNEETPKNLYQYFMPNIIVKGGDYKKEDVVGYDLMINSGGDVKIINFVNGFSTSKIIKKIST